MTKSILTTARLACTLSSITAFSPPIHHRHAIPPSKLSASKNDEFDGFNPFQPGSKISTPSSGILTVGSAQSNTTPGGRISPRSMKMKEITTSLLNAISDPDAVQEILVTNQDFLLEQFNNLDCVLEEDSIYTPDMNREERFGRYKQVMGERIEGARVPAARNTLKALMEFVLSRE